MSIYLIPRPVNLLNWFNIPVSPVVTLNLDPRGLRAWVRGIITWTRESTTSQGSLGREREEGNRCLIYWSFKIGVRGCGFVPGGGRRIDGEGWVVPSTVEDR